MFWQNAMQEKNNSALRSTYKEEILKNKPDRPSQDAKKTKALGRKKS